MVRDGFGALVKDVIVFLLAFSPLIWVVADRADGWLGKVLAIVLCLWSALFWGSYCVMEARQKAGEDADNRLQSTMQRWERECNRRVERVRAGLPEEEPEDEI